MLDMQTSVQTSVCTCMPASTPSYRQVCRKAHGWTNKLATYIMCLDATCVLVSVDVPISFPLHLSLLAVHRCTHPSLAVSLSSLLPLPLHALLPACAPIPSPAPCSSPFRSSVLLQSPSHSPSSPPCSSSYRSTCSSLLFDYDADD